jgi:hypothetical protein
LKALGNVERRHNKSSSNKTLLKVGRAALFWAIVLAVLLALYRMGLAHYHVKPRTRIAQVLAATDAQDAFVWGSSHAQCIDLPAMGWNGYNNGSYAQDLFEVGYKVRAILPRLESLKLAFISISYFSFSIDNGNASLNGDKSRSWIRIEMYASYPFSLAFIRGDFNNWMKGMLHPLVTSDHFAQAMMNPLKPLKPIKARKRLALVPKKAAEVKAALMKQKSPRRHGWLKRHAAGRAKRGKAAMADMAERNPRLAEETYAALSGAIRRLQAQGVRVVLFTPPFYRSYNKLYNPDHQERMRALVNKAVAETGASYYDFSNAPEFRDPIFFKNSDHLTEAGGTLFSLRLLEALGDR